MQDLYQVIKVQLSRETFQRDDWYYLLLFDRRYVLIHKIRYKISSYKYVLLVQSLCITKRPIQRWNLLSICHLYLIMMVDKKHHHCTGDIVLKINVAYVGTRRVRYSYQPKRMPMQEKARSSHTISISRVEPWQSIYYWPILLPQ